MNLKQLILVILSTVSLSLSAQDTYYYYKGEQIPLTINPQKVNVITPLSNIQHAPARYPNTLKAGLAIESVIQDNNVCMNIIVCKTNSAVLSEYIDSINSVGHSIALPCYLNAQGEEMIPSGYIYAKLKNTTNPQGLQNFVNHFDLAVDHQNTFMPLWYVLRTTSGDLYTITEKANLLLKTGYFEAAEPDFIYYYAWHSISWDENVSEQWGLYNAENNGIDINASSAWNYATGKGVKVGIFDSGIDYTHEDLCENIDLICYDIETGTDQRFIYNDHGTHVAGIVGASRNNGKFGAGVAPDAKLISISTKLDDHSICASEKMANGFNWAVQHNVDIINCSLGWGKCQIMTDAIENALYKGRSGKGCILVAATGNGGNSYVSSPANCLPGILAVGSIDSTGIRDENSNYGVDLDVVAPGVNILSTLLNNTVGYESGTSMAAPHVSGIAALILELNPDLTRKEVCDIIEQSTIKVGNVEYTTDSIRPNGTWNQEYGYGLVDALKAVQNTPRKQIDY